MRWILLFLHCARKRILHACENFAVAPDDGGVLFMRGIIGHNVGELALVAMSTECCRTDS